jgi:hypothetical protein
MRTRRDKWIQHNLKKGNKIVSEVIQECASIEEMKKKEAQYIALFKSFGARLVNGTLGGDGVVGMVHSEVIREWNRKTKSKIIYCFDYSTKKLIAEYPSAIKMCDELNLHRSQVGYVLSGKGNHSKGYTFSHTNICPQPIPIAFKAWNKGLKTIGLQGFKTTAVAISRKTETHSFATIKEACAFLGIKNHSVFCIAMRKNKYMDWVITRLIN